MKKIILILLIFVGFASAQESNTQLMSGNFNFDSHLAFDETKPDLNDPAVKARKSPMLAGFLSAVVPGAGEVYNDDYLTAAIFFGVEVAAVSASVVYNQKGDDATTEFEDYANGHWSVDKYADWIYYNKYNYESATDKVEYDELFNNGKVSWKALHRVEDEIPTFSHNLEVYGHQQYYEMIGKYKQFRSGWDDFKEDYEANDSVSPNFTHYSGMRGDANDLYNIASKAVVVVVINHIASAVEAAWSASKYNKSLETNVTMEKQQFGFKTDIYPQLNVKYNF